MRFPKILPRAISPRKVPRLPYELQQDIFELTAQASPQCAPKLALVSSQVQYWWVPFKFPEIFREVQADSLRLIF
jgi:hypothetical protein